MDGSFVRDRITQLRMNKGVSEYQMSYDLGHSRGYINNISSGKTLPSMTEFLAVCEYFCITPAEFFNENFNDPRMSKELCDAINALSAEEARTVKQLLELICKNKKTDDAGS